MNAGLLATQPPERRRLLIRLLQLVFVAAMIACFAVAVIPGPEAPEGLPWDKANHFGAFYLLSILGLAAFPQRHPLRVAVGLSIFGALIEVVQAIPAVHRDGDVFDWVADTLGIAAASGPILLVRWRRWVSANA